MAEDNENGWISVHRKIWNNPIWNDNEPFDMRSAWIDLLLLVNHTDNKTLFSGELITVKRGDKILSIRFLADRWKWSNDKVLKFLKLLESDNMIKRDSNKKRTLITVVNYGFYQDRANTKRTQNEHLPNTYRTQTEQSPNTERTQTERNNNNNNELIMSNNDNNENNNTPFNPPTGGADGVKKKKKFKYPEEMYQDIVDYLNLKAGKNFRWKTDETVKLINGRLDDGYTVDDFRQVIDVKVSDWKDDNKMNEFLRPNTLFRPSNFENYLNKRKSKTMDDYNKELESWI